jgi:hypothetical protein
LKSWAPRRPSAELDQKLFGKILLDDPPVAAIVPQRSGLFAGIAGWFPNRNMVLAWLAPAAACVVVVSATVSERHASLFSDSAGQNHIAFMSISNPTYASYLPGSFQRSQNRWDTFEWTDGGGFHSSKQPFPRVSTHDSN